MYTLRTTLRLAVLVTMIAFTGSRAVGADSNNKGKIEGTKWSSVEAMVKGTKLPAGILKLEFSKDGKMVYTVGDQKFTGTYELGDGNTVTFMLDRELAGRKKHVQTIKITDAKMNVMDSDGTALDFEKMK